MPEHSHRELILQGENHFEQGAYVDALHLFEQVLEAEPEHVHALNDAGITAGELDQARKAVEYFERALAVQPDFEPAFFGLLDVLAERDEVDAAVHAFLRYEEHIPNTADKQQYADLLTERTAPATPHSERIRDAEKLLMQDQPREALSILHEVLEQDPDNANALNDAGHAYVDLGEAVEASQCFESALEADPGHQSAFYSLVDLLVRTETPELAVEVFLQYHENMPDDEEKAKYASALGGWAEGQTAGAAAGDGLPTGASDVRVAPSNVTFPTPNSTDGLRIAIVCGPDRKFITDIEEGLRKKGHAVHPCYFDEKVDPQRIQQAMDWADVTWFEWCDEILVHASQNLRKTSPVVCRLHSYEAFTNMPAQVSWGFVDTTVFVAPHIEQIFREQFDADVATTVIPNGVDLNRMRFKDREPSFNIAYVGYINHKKNPELLLQCMTDLVQRDDRYVLHIAGTFQELRHKLYFDKMIPELGLDDNVILHGWVDDIDAWLDDKSYLVSTSVLESFGMGIAEAVAKGIKPIIHNWVGAEHIYPQEWLFNTVGEFSEQVLAEDYDSNTYRALIEERYSLQDRITSIEQLLADVISAQPATRSQDQARPPAVHSGIRKKHLFIVGQPRSGTTITWKTIRRDSRWRCYDEPFNQHHRARVEAGVDHPKEILTEFLDIPELFRQHWSPILPYEELLDRFIGHQETYVRALLDTSDRVCVDFTHVTARIAHLREIAPDALIVHLVRDPRAWVTSHLKPYGQWLPGLPEKFFLYRAGFNYWSRQELADGIGASGFAHEQLLQVWDHMTRAAEAARPDVTLQFEEFALSPEAILRDLYRRVGMEWEPLDVSGIHAPNPPFRDDATEWLDACQRHVSDIGRRFVYPYTHSDGLHT